MLKFAGDSVAVWHKSSGKEAIEGIKADIQRIVDFDQTTMKIDNEIFAETLSQPKPAYQPSRGRGSYRGGVSRGSRGGRGGQYSQT